MTTQIEFKFRSAQQAPAFANITKATEYLHQAAGWVTAKQLAEAIGTTDRQIRKIAEHSAGMIVSGPGCPGYKHLHHCTSDELGEVANRLESQAKHMQSRAVQIRRKAHAMIR